MKAVAARFFRAVAWIVRIISGRVNWGQQIPGIIVRYEAQIKETIRELIRLRRRVEGRIFELVEEKEECEGIRDGPRTAAESARPELVLAEQVLYESYARRVTWKEQVIRRLQEWLGNLDNAIGTVEGLFAIAAEAEFACVNVLGVKEDTKKIEAYLQEKLTEASDSFEEIRRIQATASDAAQLDREEVADELGMEIKDSKPDADSEPKVKARRTALKKPRALVAAVVMTESGGNGNGNGNGKGSAHPTKAPMIAAS